MKNLRCIIIEDEPLAVEVLRDYINQVPHLTLVATFEDAIYALQGLKSLKVDVIFLDIHLPKLKGLDFLRVLDDKPQVVLTTAYHEYAIEGFDLAVVDYLLKPIEFERFLQAVNKLKFDQAAPSSSSDSTGYRFFRVNRSNIKINLSEILYIESLKDYVKIHTDHKSFVTKGQIGELTKSLSDIEMVRIHRSYSVAIQHIQAYSGTDVTIANKKIPIGRSYKEYVRGLLP